MTEFNWLKHLRLQSELLHKLHMSHPVIQHAFISAACSHWCNMSPMKALTKWQNASEKQSPVGLCSEARFRRLLQ